MGKQSINFQRKTLMVATIMMCTFVAISSSTLAWFISNKNANAHVSDITIDDKINLKVKYFIGNYKNRDVTSDYIGYYEPGQLDTPAQSVNSYDTDFITVNTTAPYFGVSYLVPGIRYTYALEISSSYGGDSSIALTLNSFSNLFRDLTRKDYVLSGTDNTSATARRIGLADGISLFASVYNSDTSQLTSTQAANNFVTAASSTLTDKFDFDSKQNLLNGTSGADTAHGELLFDNAGYELCSSTFSPTTPEDENMQIFFFSFEFSNLSNSYYSSKTPTQGTIDTGAAYYYKDAIDGSSNVYKNGWFKINDLKLYRK